MRSLIPPVGFPVSMGRSDAELPPAEFPGFYSLLLASGTAALAAAMKTAQLIDPSCTADEVILPAYGCPDLVAAAVFAGLKPVLVDIETTFHGYDIALLDAAISERTLAVVAVNLLGVKERLADIATMLSARRQPVYLIEDNAQWLPEPFGDPAQLTGDFVVNSFGRGKPASLLGGGMLLMRDAYTAAAAKLDVSSVQAGRYKATLRTVAYNNLLRPWCYRMVSMLPMLSIGNTEFHALESIDAMSDTHRQWMPGNIACYLGRSEAARDAVAEILEALSALRDLAIVAPAGTGRLLRYPVQLLDPAERDVMLRRLNVAGFSATALYRHTLMEIPGVGQRARLFASDDNARSYAAGLMTLPLQHGMDRVALARLKQVLI